MTKEKILSERNEFKFIKLYTDYIFQNSSELFENEQIDVLIKYIDLSDPKKIERI